MISKCLATTYLMSKHTKFHKDNQNTVSVTHLTGSFGKRKKEIPTQLERLFVQLTAEQCCLLPPRPFLFGFVSDTTVTECKWSYELFCKACNPKWSVHAGSTKWSSELWGKACNPAGSTSAILIHNTS